jgi:lactoylglutathione lyase
MGATPGKPAGQVGIGVSLCFMCEDAIAIYREALAARLEASEPQVGNAMSMMSLLGPDGYRLDFESLTDVPEETKLSEVKR